MKASVVLTVWPGAESRIVAWGQKQLGKRNNEEDIPAKPKTAEENPRLPDSHEN
jgi:hypothetical protein